MMPVDIAALTDRITQLADAGHELSDHQVKAATEVFGPGLIIQSGGGKDEGRPPI